MARSAYDQLRKMDHARYFDEVNQRMRISPSPITSLPLTLACWGTAQTSGKTAMYVGSDNSGAQRDHWRLATAVGVRAVASVRSVAAGSGGAVSLKTVPVGYYHSCSTFESSTSRTCWMNGLAGAVDTTLIDPLSASIECLTIGIEEKFVASDYVGDIFWPCFWNVILTESEIRGLARRVPPWEIRPGNIVAMPDMRTGYDPYMKALWSFIEGPIQKARPPFIWRPRRRMFRSSVAAPSGRIMSSLAGCGGLAGFGGIAGRGGGLAG